MIMMLSGVFLSFVFFGGLNGIGVGTVIATLIVGRIIHFMQEKFAFVKRIKAMSVVAGEELDPISEGLDEELAE